MSKQNNRSIGLKEYLAALRLPFVTASILPFVAGSLLAKNVFKYHLFFLGLLAVVATHLGANLINDYADSRSGVDWLDKKRYKLFGGSKLIQEGIFPEKFYRNLSIYFFLSAFCSVVLLSVFLKSALVLGFYFIILLLGLSYSHKPFQFSYHRAGEAVIFLLFGPALVMGGYFIQSQAFPDLESFILSLPFGFLTTAILFANEVPDASDDKKAGKFTWAGMVKGSKAFILYLVLIFFAFLSIALNIAFEYLSIFSLFAFIFILNACRAAAIMKKFSFDKEMLLKSSRETIKLQTLVSLIIIIDLLL